MAIESACSRPRISKRQIEFLEYLIWKSKNADDVTRKLLIWLLRQTDQLTTQVFVNCPHEVCREIAHGLHDMGSSNGTTHLDALFWVAGSVISPVLYSGTYADGGDRISSEGFAVFIRDRNCHEPSKLVEYDMRAINAIVEPDPYGLRRGSAGNDR